VNRAISRRDFLSLTGLSAAALAFRGLPPIESSQPVGLARVAASWVGLYHEPSFRSTRLTTIGRDEILTLLAEEQADEGPSRNPVWFRLPEGYAHSGNLQRVKWQLQQPVETIPEGGMLVEVAVPYTRSYRAPDPADDPLYRLYYESTAWVDQVLYGADGRQWYRIVDDLLHIRYFARAEHLRPVRADELTPISPEVPLHQKRIEVSLARQELRAYEGERLVLETLISSGIPSDTPGSNGIPTATPDGHFYIDKKMPSRHMGDGRLTPDLEAYELPGVPWVSFFHFTGVAFHGTYWHNDFGRPRSHGCVNMRNDEARWLYRWSLPFAPAGSLLHIGRGTSVYVR
jgi:hypothetical protein